MMMEQNSLILLGGGGHTQVLLDLIALSGQYHILGILDPRQEAGLAVPGIPILGGDDLLPDLYAKGIKYIAIGVGSVKNNSKRRMLYEAVRQIGFSVPTLLHPQTIISRNAVLAPGVQIMAGAVVQTNTFIGENTVVNTGAIIDHDVHIGNHAFVSPGVTISGGVTIGEGVFIGAGATVIQGIKIGRGSIVAAGAVVIRDVPDGVTVKGVPAR